MTRTALTLLAALAAGGAAWGAAGAVAPVASGMRAGLLPAPFWAVAIACGTALLVHRRPALAATTVSLVLAWLPWLPVPVPAAAFLWTGPLATGVLVAWAMAAAAHGGFPGGALGRTFSRLAHPRRAVRAAFSVAFLAYLGGAWAAAPTVPGGDEPHYLVIASSVIADGDLRIENNHRRLDYLPYFGGELRPDYLRRGIDGEIYSIHAPGLGVLVAPALALAGHRGVSVFLALVCAAGAALAWQSAHEAARDAGAAWFAWAAVTLTAPFLTHGFTVYPDGVASVLAVSATLALVRGEATPARWAWHGAALALLPWLHTRYALLAAGYGAAILLRLVPARNWRGAAAFLAVPLASAAAWFGFFVHVYGTPNPAAPYGGYTQAGVRHVPFGLTGLLFDQQYGLLAAAPVLATAGVGLLLMWRARRAGQAPLRRLSLELAIIFAVYAAACASYRMWWGGFSGPARFLVPIVLSLAVPAAVSWARIASPVFRALSGWALTWSLGFTVMLLCVERGALAYTTRASAAPWASWISPVADLGAGLPGMFRTGPSVAIGQAACWLGAAGLAWMGLAQAARRFDASARQLFAVWAPPAIGLAALAALTVSWQITGARPARPSAARSLVNAMGSRTWIGLSRAERSVGWRVERPSAVLSSLSLRPELLPDRQGTVLATGPLPAGRYRLHARPDPAGPGHVSVHVGRGGSLTRTLSLDGLRRDASGAATADLSWPVGIEALAIRQHGDVRLSDVWLQPLAIGNGAAGAAGRAGLAAVYGSGTAYFTTGGVFPEPTGFWVSPGVDVRVVFERSVPAAPLAVRLRNAGVANEVTFGADREGGTWSLQPGEERLVPAPAGARTLVLRLRASRGTRPAEHDPGNRDLRLLGVWVEIVRT